MRCSSATDVAGAVSSTPMDTELKVLPDKHALASAAADAAEVLFRPHAAPNVTVQEWETYRAQVRAALTRSEKARLEDHEVQYFDATTGTQFIFTTLGHPAHPAWISRRSRSYGGKDYLDQVGYFAGSWKHYQAWFELYRTRRALPGPSTGTWHDK